MNPNHDYKIDECVSKLLGVAEAEQHKLIWSWIKQSYINFQQFSALMTGLKVAEANVASYKIEE